MEQRLAIIPAAGLGTRIRSVHEGQKACMRIKEKSLIEYAIASVEGICDSAIIVGEYGYDELKDTVLPLQGKYDLELHLINQGDFPKRFLGFGPSHAFFASKKFLDRSKIEVGKLTIVLPDVLFVDTEKEEDPSLTLRKILYNADNYLHFLDPFQISTFKIVPVSKHLSKFGVAYRWHSQQIVTVQDELVQNMHEFAVFERLIEKPTENQIDKFSEHFDRIIAKYSGTTIIYHPDIFLSYFVKREQTGGLSGTDHIDVLNLYAKSLPWRKINLSGKQYLAQVLNQPEAEMSYAWMVPGSVEIVDIGTPDDYAYAKSLLEK